MGPPIAAELIFSEQANHNFSKTLGELKRSTLSIQNRLKSIRQDAAFAQQAAEAYGRPLIANERCGSWYIDPVCKAASAYFKSTDGHTGVWKFSSRRLNLHLLEIIGKNDGCVIIDSTRRGKRMPDALSKTIPIWCSVLNRTLFAGSQSPLHELYTPPQVVSESEHAQISALLPSFVAALQALKLPLDKLRAHISKPLRPMWVTPDSHLQKMDIVFDDFHPVICCTVSRRVAGGELSEGGYIQGAGDDTENWAYGLTPPMFWVNEEILSLSGESELPALIESLVEAAASGGAAAGEGLRCVKPTSNLYVAPTRAISAADASAGSCIMVLHSKVTEQSAWQTSACRLDIGLGVSKVGSRNLRTALPFMIAFVEKSISCSTESVPLAGPAKRIVLTCENGKDLSIGVALAILCVFYSDDGKLLDHGRKNIRFDKDFIRSRLGWISTFMPDANPSRATIQSVNSFLMPR